MCILEKPIQNNIGSFKGEGNAIPEMYRNMLERVYFW
jgi:hypothetical protein